MSINLSNVIALALGSDDILQIQDAVGTVLWQKTIYYNVSISAGSNGTVSVNGVSGNYSQSVPSGTVLTVEGIGNTGYNFNEWSDGNTANPRTITVTGNLTLTASFAPVALPNYFYVEDVSGSANTLSIVKSDSSVPTIEVFKSTDQVNWESIGTTSDTAITATIPANGKLYLKATANQWGSGNNGNIINCISPHNIGGNTMSLLYGDNYNSQTTFPAGSSNNFDHLFQGNNQLISAEELILPAMTLTSQCYLSMFESCDSMVKIPNLPATTLAERCYSDIFRGCSSLTTVPANLLPATTLAEQCYGNMFLFCSSLTQAPVLPATTLTQNCYAGMFNGCTSLTTAPVLPATTLAVNCYTWMFARSGVTTVTTYAQDISASGCLNDWLGSVSSTGDFYNLGGATYPSGSSGIPEGWTEHTSL